MTLKVYLIHHGSYHDTDFTKETEEIKTLNPDKILLFCFEEADAEYIFKNLCPKLSPWLVENNKLTKVLIINPDNHYIAPNIVTEKTFGYQLNLHGCINQFDSMGIDFTKSHTYATKLFTCYNKVPKYHRALTVDLLAKENLIDDGIVTVHNPHNTQRDNNNGPEYYYDYYDKKVRIDEEDFDINNLERFNSDVMPKSFLLGFIDIVTETQYIEKKQFLTEKTTKSIAALKPFLSVANINFHKYLEQEYGIEPYPELFDYSFDNEVNIFHRANGVVQNIKRLKPLFENEYEKNKIHDLLLPRMIENKKRLIDYTFNKEKMVPPSLKFCTETTDYKLFGDVQKCKYIFEFYERMNWLAK